MAVFTPEQLTTALTDLTLTIAGHLVLEQDSVTRHSPLSTIRARLQDMVEDDPTHYDTAIENTWTTPVQDIGDDLPSVADTGHTHTPTEVGLPLVQNLSPSMLPVSTAAQTALNGKLSVDDLTGLITEWTLSIPPEW